MGKSIYYGRGKKIQGGEVWNVQLGRGEICIKSPSVEIGGCVKGWQVVL